MASSSGVNVTDKVDRRWGHSKFAPDFSISEIDAHVPINDSTRRSVCTLPNGEVHVSESFKRPVGALPPYEVRERNTWHSTLALYETVSNAAQDSVKVRQMKAYIDGCIFTQYLSHCQKNSDRQLIKALVLRWWPTTHSFHFPKYELGFTPLDFAMITGIGVMIPGTVPLPQYDESSIPPTAYQSFLTRIMPHHRATVRFEEHKVKATDVYVYIVEMLNDDRVSAKKLAKLFLFYVLGTVFFPDSRQALLPALFLYVKKINEVNNYDWGSAFLARVYAALDLVSVYSRKTRPPHELRKYKTFLACWQFLEFFVFEYMGVLHPYLKEGAESKWPISAKYGYDNILYNENFNSHDYDAALTQFEYRSLQGAIFQPYLQHPMYADDFVCHHRNLSAYRLMLVDIQLGGFWYLGERFSFQLEGKPFIPTDPPRFMSKLPWAIVSHHTALIIAGKMPVLKVGATKKQFAEYWEGVSIGPVLPPISRPYNQDIFGVQSISEQYEIPYPPTQLQGNVYETPARDPSYGHSAASSHDPHRSHRYLQWEHVSTFPTPPGSCIHIVPRAPPAIDENMHNYNYLWGIIDQQSAELAQLRLTVAELQGRESSQRTTSQTPPLYPTPNLGDSSSSGLYRPIMSPDPMVMRTHGGETNEPQDPSLQPGWDFGF